jgi:hypothetical protein
VKLDKQAVMFVVEAIAKRIKILDRMGRPSITMAVAFKETITLLTKISAQDIDIWIGNKIPPAQRNAFIHEIAAQTKQHLAKKDPQNASPSHFFRVEVSPGDFEQKISAIAANAANTLCPPFGEAADVSKSDAAVRRFEF